ncbi:MAG: hypothetical protein U1F67_08675 [Rubrivivax sp.]
MTPAAAAPSNANAERFAASSTTVTRAGSIRAELLHRTHPTLALATHAAQVHQHRVCALHQLDDARTPGVVGTAQVVDAKAAVGVARGVGTGEPRRKLAAGANEGVVDAAEQPAHEIHSVDRSRGDIERRDHRHRTVPAPKCARGRTASVQARKPNTRSNSSVRRGGDVAHDVGA